MRTQKHLARTADAVAPGTTWTSALPAPAVVVGVDGLPGSLLAVAAAAAEAASRGARLDLVHVALHAAHDPLPDATARAREASPGIRVRAVRRTGPAGEGLVDVTRSDTWPGSRGGDWLGFRSGRSRGGAGCAGS